jgi:anaerobic selenocysteine-containing dehydrogenase
MPQTIRTVCPLDCPDRCALDVDVEGARILKIDGSQRSPLTAGYICAKVRGFDRRVDGPDRVLHPMLRKGPKGSDTWTRISWDEATSLLAEKFGEIVRTDGPLAIVPYSYSGSNGLLTSHSMDERFWNRLGASNIVRTLCAANTGAAWESVFGDMPGSDPLELQHSDAVVLWGVNPSASSIHLVPLVREVLRRGGYLCAVDPRATPLARQATDHVAPLPGTDVAVAMAMIRIAIEEGLVDPAFLQQHGRGFDALSRAAREWTPEKASEISGVPADGLARVPRALARARAPFFRVGWGQERNRNGTDATRAVLMLRAIFGKFNERGSGVTLSTTRGYRMDLSKAEGTHLRSGPVRELNMSRLAHDLDHATDPPIRALFVYNCNPVATAPNQTALVRALRRESLFVAVHEQVFSDTCACADLVLPATTFLEHHDLCRSYGGYALQWCTPAVAPRGEALPNHALFQRLAAAMGFKDDEFDVSETDLARQIYGTARGTSAGFETLEAERFVPIAAPRPFVDVTPSRKFIDFAGSAPPTYVPNPLGEHLPFAVISPSTDRGITSTLYELMEPGTAVVSISPSDASVRGLRDGETVRLSNPLGEVVARLAISPDLRPGVLSLPKGLWRRATRNGFTSNALSPDHVDRTGGGACYNDARAEISRV